MRVLYLTPRALVEARSGGTIKSAALLEHLERLHDVDVASFVRPGQGWRRDAGRTVTVPLHRPRSVGRLVASYARRRPLSVERNHSDEMSMTVRSLVDTNGYDVVFVDGWLMAQYLPRGYEGSKLLHQHNAEHLMWERHAELETSPIRRFLVRSEATRVRRYETSIVPRFDVVFAVSEDDRAALLSIANGGDVRILPNVADPGLLERPPLEPPREPVVLFFGTLSWAPNLEGMKRFLHDGLASLQREVPGIRLVVAGSGAPRALSALVARMPGVELVRDTPDDESLYRSARAFVDVGLGGSGTRVKILNALARGVPVVATADAARGLDVTAGGDLLVATDSNDVVRALTRLLTDDASWRALSEHGRDLVRRRYVPDVAFRSLDDALAAMRERT
jgi:glycosyltransferase involved in cell wall biosynthesis